MDEHGFANCQRLVCQKEQHFGLSHGHHWRIVGSLAVLFCGESAVVCRCIAEYLLFHHEHIWLVQLGAEKKRSLCVSNQLVQQARLAMGFDFIFHFLVDDLVYVGAVNQQQHTVARFIGFINSRYGDVVDGQKKNGKLDCLDCIQPGSHTFEFL